MDKLICNCPLCISFYSSINFCKKINSYIKKKIKKDEKFIIN